MLLRTDFFWIFELLLLLPSFNTKEEASWCQSLKDSVLTGKPQANSVEDVCHV